MPLPHIRYEHLPPPPDLHDFVESFWMLANTGDLEHRIVILPDGRFDLIFARSGNQPDFDITLRGLDTESQAAALPPHTTFMAVSFKLPAIEYLLHQKLGFLTNTGIVQSPHEWDIEPADLDTFGGFAEKLAIQLCTMRKTEMDARKQTLFHLLYENEGGLPVYELAERVYWSARQINRYFRQTFGIALKAYCNILRFKASLPYLKKGRLYPNLDFADQNHFIREVKRLSGVTPKELSKNQNDRFILFSALP